MSRGRLLAVLRTFGIVNAVALAPDAVVVDFQSLSGAQSTIVQTFGL